MTRSGKRYHEREMPIWSGKDGGLMGAGSLSTSMRVSPWKPAIVEVIDPLGLYHPPVWLACGICWLTPLTR